MLGGRPGREVVVPLSASASAWRDRLRRLALLVSLRRSPPVTAYDMCVEAEVAAIEVEINALLDDHGAFPLIRNSLGPVASAGVVRVEARTCCARPFAGQPADLDGALVPAPAADANASLGSMTTFGSFASLASAADRSDRESTISRERADAMRSGLNASHAERVGCHRCALNWWVQSIHHWQALGDLDRAAIARTWAADAADRLGETGRADHLRQPLTGQYLSWAWGRIARPRGIIGPLIADIECTSAGG